MWDISHVGAAAFVRPCFALVLDDELETARMV